MLEKVVAVAAAAGGLVLAGAGLAVADVQDAASSSHNVAGNTALLDRCVNSDYALDHSVPKNPRAPQAPHAPEAPHNPYHPQDTPKPEEPHHPVHPQEHPHGNQPRPNAPLTPAELAETGAPGTGLTLVTGAGLLLGGAVLYRRARVMQR